MQDTIDMLEAIGKDASLRHASPDALAGLLAEAKASDALKAAVESGDSAPLFMELGEKPMQSPQSVQTFHEVEEPGTSETDQQPLPAPEPEKP